MDKIRDLNTALLVLVLCAGVCRGRHFNTQYYRIKYDTLNHFLGIIMDIVVIAFDRTH